MLWGRPNYEEQTPLDIMARPGLRVTGTGEELRAAAGDAFDWTTLGLMHNNARVDPSLGDSGFENLNTMHAGGDMVDALTEKESPQDAWSKPDWEKSAYYRSGIIYSKDMTPYKAQALAEQFDEREYRRALLARSPGGFWRGTGRLGASLAATALDPVNYIPIFGTAARAAMIERAGLVMGHALTGAVEASVVTAVTEPLVAAQQAESGDTEAWGHVVQDLALAGGVGALFGVGVGAWAKRRNRQMQALAKAVTDIRAGDEVDVAPVFRDIESDLVQAQNTERMSVAMVPVSIESQPRDLSSLQPGQMTYDEFLRWSRGVGSPEHHRSYIEVAIDQGLDIPDGVKSRYPDLFGQPSPHGPAQMTYDEFRRWSHGEGDIEDHRAYIDMARRQGQPIPDIIQKEYPEIFERPLSPLPDFTAPKEEILETPEQAGARELVAHSHRDSNLEAINAPLRETAESPVHPIIDDGGDNVVGGNSPNVVAGDRRDVSPEVQLVDEAAASGKLQRIETNDGIVVDEAAEWQKASEGVERAENWANAMEIAVRCITKGLV